MQTKNDFPEDAVDDLNYNPYPAATYWDKISSFNTENNQLMVIATFITMMAGMILANLLYPWYIQIIPIIVFFLSANLIGHRIIKFNEKL